MRLWMEITYTAQYISTASCSSVFIQKRREFQTETYFEFQAQLIISYQLNL